MSGSCAVEPRKVNDIQADALDEVADDEERSSETSLESESGDGVGK